MYQVLAQDARAAALGAFRLIKRQPIDIVTCSLFVAYLSVSLKFVASAKTVLASLSGIINNRNFANRSFFDWHELLLIPALLLVQNLVKKCAGRTSVDALLSRRFSLRCTLAGVVCAAAMNAAQRVFCACNYERNLIGFQVCPNELVKTVRRCSAQFCGHVRI